METLGVLTEKDKGFLRLILEGKAYRSPSVMNTRVPEVSAPGFRYPVVDGVSGEEIGELSEVGARIDLSIERYF